MKYDLENLIKIFDERTETYKKNNIKDPYLYGKDDFYLSKVLKHMCEEIKLLKESNGRQTKRF